MRNSKHMLLLSSARFACDVNKALVNVSAMIVVQLALRGCIFYFICADVRLAGPSGVELGRSIVFL